MYNATFTKNVSHSSINYNGFQRNEPEIRRVYTGNARILFQYDVPNGTFYFPAIRFHRSEDYFVAVNSTGPIQVTGYLDNSYFQLDAKNNYNIIFANDSTSVPPVGAYFYSSDERYNYNFTIDLGTSEQVQFTNTGVNPVRLTIEQLTYSVGG